MIHFTNLKRFLGIIAFTFLLLNCKSEKNEETKEAGSTSDLIVSKDAKWSVRMALSEIHRNPVPGKIDFRETPIWNYTPGLVTQAIARVYEVNGDKKLFEYSYGYLDDEVQKNGNIPTYKLDKYNLDMIKSGDIAFYLYQKTKEPRFRIAMDSLHYQLEHQPTTSEGGYWHKKVYPYQMWLDGVFMAEPFHTKYALEFMEGEELKNTLDKVVLQFDLIEKYSRDPETGLYYHGWDESKEQKWANKQTGLSQHFWSRGMGWYGMAMVDVLDYLPESHPGRERIIGYLQHYAAAIIKYQDEGGTWWQVLNLPEREGNYLEATGTSMFTYVLAKGANKGYISKAYLDNAKKGFEGILEQFITVEDNGVINLNKCCGVAGLGGNPYRDGSFDYYVNEIIRSNDPKGTGPFMFAALELNK